MKRLAVFAALALALLAAPALLAQDHGEVGVFADYVRLHNAGDANFWGIGGRASFNVSKHIQLEADMGYDFEKTIISGTVFNTGTGTITTVRSPLRLLHATFGPKLMTGSGPVRAFVYAKGGFLNFSSFSGPATGGSFTNAISNVPNGDTNGVFYPGGGVEAYLGPVGLRLDVGDMMYFDNGANHNLQITFGPHIRF
jgi:hypothetical protein